MPKAAKAKAPRGDQCPKTMTVNQLLNAVGQLRARNKELEQENNAVIAECGALRKQVEQAAEGRRLRTEHREMQSLLASIGRRATSGAAGKWTATPQAAQVSSSSAKKRLAPEKRPAPVESSSDSDE